MTGIRSGKNWGSRKISNLRFKNCFKVVGENHFYVLGGNEREINNAEK